VSAAEEEALGRCGSYELLVELASGGMATVFLARAADGRDAPLVAIKRPHKHLAKDKTFLSMLVDEARLASAIKHDNVVKVKELGFDAGDPFIVMDYIEGSALSDIRAELSALGRALDPRVAVRITLDALAGLQAAHVLHDPSGKHLQIVHRDVSPHNVLIGWDGLARLTDFGIAKAIDRVQHTQTHEVKGKLAYLAPERIDKRRLCTVQSDVFSMAVVLWECIAGRRLFRGEEAIETLQEVMTAPIPSLRRIGAPVSAALDDTISKGLSRDLDERFKTAAEFAAALEQAAGRANTATPAEVALLVEALFGERLRVRHEKIRGALGDVKDVARVLEASGLHERPAPTDEMREREKRHLENIAPPAPSARYAFGASEKLSRGLSSPRLRLAAALGVALALIFVGAGFMARRRATSEPAIRRVLVTLPFTATRVTFDDQTRLLTPPSEVVVFDVPRESGVRHRVTAVAVDGARAEAFVREADGVARPEGDYAIESMDAAEEAPAAQPTPSASAAVVVDLSDHDPHATGGKRRTRKFRAPRPTATAPVASAATPPPTTAPAPVGSVKDGFTKLR
jgi:tRNA A-37 threonylcarbamoyl transferase component Bud32